MADARSGASRKTVKGELKHVGRGGRVAFWLAALVVLGGAGLWWYEHSRNDAAPASSARSVDPSMVTGFAGKSGATPGSGPAADVVAGPAMVRIGASFIAAFAIGFLLRSFIKWGLLLLGIVAIGVYLLQRTGAIDVNWATVESQTGQATSWIKSQTDSFSKFITGALPSGTSAAAGLWSGFRRKVSI